MAFAQVVAKTEERVPHAGDAITSQNVSNYNRDIRKFADPSGAHMKALVWNGKNSVKMQDTFKPAIVEPTDIVVRTTGSTVCGSDLHILHGVVAEMEKGDILGHEFCGIVESIGASVKKYKPGDRVVCSFQLACGKCRYCQQKLVSTRRKPLVVGSQQSERN
jgi:threonine dehydrogenase-like Zn-dependent dehydrogenase